MDLSQYLETMKNLPERFSNLNFWRGVRKLRDKMVDTFEYVGEWGASVENGLSELGDDLSTTKSQLSESINALNQTLVDVNGKPFKYDFNWISNSYVNGNDGSFVDYDGWKRSDYIELKYDQNIYITSTGYSNNPYNAWYDENHTYIGMLNIKGNQNKEKIPIPTNAKYVIVSCPDTTYVSIYTEIVSISDIKSDITTLENTDISLDSRISALENAGGGGGGALVFNSASKSFDSPTVEVLESNLDTSESGSLLVPYPKVIYARFSGTLADIEANSLIVNALMSGSVAVSNGQQYSATVQFHDEPMYAVRVNDTSYKLYSAWIPFTVKTKGSFRVTMPNLTVKFTTAGM